jgi:ribosomal protein L12E/L44/L45/RPP1/RPP2
MSEYPSVAAMKAAVELEIEKCLGIVTTQSIGALIQKAIDEAIAQEATKSAPVPGASQNTAERDPSVMPDRAGAAPRSSEERAQPRVIDFDDGGISVRLDGKDLRVWEYRDEAERRTKMLCAREYVEGWCDGRRA